MDRAEVRMTVWMELVKSGSSFSLDQVDQIVNYILTGNLPLNRLARQPEDSTSSGTVPPPPPRENPRSRESPSWIKILLGK